MVYGVRAYAIWGMFPAFFGLLGASGPFEILAHRIVWTLFVMVAVLVAVGQLRRMREIDGRSRCSRPTRCGGGDGPSSLSHPTQLSRVRVPAEPVGGGA